MVRANASGFARAATFRKCMAHRRGPRGSAHWATTTPHAIDVVFAPASDLLYIDNVKTGSSTLRELLGTPFVGSGPAWRERQRALLSRCPTTGCRRACQRAFGQAWEGADWSWAHFAATGTAAIHRGTCHSPMKRTNTACFGAAAIGAAFAFGVVRDPVEKFESGARQAWHQVPGGRRPRCAPAPPSSLTRPRLIPPRSAPSHTLLRIGAALHRPPLP